MKKIFSFLLLAMAFVSAWAADENVVFSDQGYTNGDEVTTYVGTDFSVTFDKGTGNNTPKYYNTGAAIRIYGGGTFTVSSSTKTISKIELGFGSGDGTNAITTDVVTFNTDTWTGNASSVVFTVGGTSGHRRLASIAVTYATGEEPNVSAPVIVGETPFIHSTEVTISCTTDGATIYYTTNGNEPTNASTEYTAAFTLTETTTVKAIAYDANNVASEVTTKTFEKTDLGTAVTTVAEYNALADSTTFNYTGTNLVVSAQKNSYLYAQDATGGILIYGTTGQTYKKGDILPAGFSGFKVTFHGAPEASNPIAFAAATDSTTLSPVDLAAADLTLSNFGIYSALRGVTVNGNNITLADGTTVATYTTFATVPANTTGKTYDVIGIMGWRDGAQFLPIEYNELDPETPVPGDQYELVTSADQIAADKEYILVYSDENVTVAMANASGTIRAIANMGEREFTLENDVVTLMSTTSVAPFTLKTSATADSLFNILIDGDKYLSWTSGNSVVTGTNAGDMTIALDSVGNALIKYNVTELRYLQYNPGSPRFCFYKGTQKYPQLYVKVADTALLGDVNGDGEVDVRDITALIDVIMNSITDNPRADVSEDGEIDVRDITALIDIIMNS